MKQVVRTGAAHKGGGKSWAMQKDVWSLIRRLSLLPLMQLLAMSTEAQPYLPDAQGRFVFEAEAYEELYEGLGGHVFQLLETPLASGGQAMQILPNSAQFYTDFFQAVNEGPALIVFVDVPAGAAGPYVPYARGVDFAGINGDDSFWLGLADDPQVGIRMNPPQNYGWTGADGSSGGTVVTLFEGVNAIGLWMREDGTVIDKVVLAPQATASQPFDFGPAPSPRGGAAAAVFSASPLVGPPPLEVSFDASASTGADGAGVATYEWDFENDGTIDDTRTSGAAFTRTFSGVGVYTVRLRITDVNGVSASSSTTLIVREPLMRDLALHYSFDALTDTSVLDESGHGHHGFLSFLTFEEGRVGMAARVDGTGGSFVEDEDAEAYLTGLDAVTVALWAKKDDPAQARGLFVGEAPSNTDRALSLRFSEPGVLTGGVTVTDETGEPATATFETVEIPSDTEWHHYALVWASGSAPQVYVDGIPIENASADTLRGSLSGMTSLMIGRGPTDLANSWTGLIDEARVYARALTRSQVAAVAVDPYPGLGTPGDPYQIVRAPTAPAIDGTREAAWDNAAVAPVLTHVNDDACDSDADCSATVSVMWDDAYLYVFADVMDDELMQDSPDTEAYNDDALDVAIDGGNDKAFQSLDADDLHMEWGWGRSATTGNRTGGDPATLSAGIEFVTVDKGDGTGYSVEGRVPLANFGVEANAGTSIGLEFMLNDDDSGDLLRNHKLAWAAPAGIDDAWRYANLWGTGRFIGTNVAAEDPRAEIPDAFAIESIYPNPFNPTAIVVLGVRVAGEYEVRVHNVLGQLIAERHVVAVAPGLMEVQLDLQNRASGVYFVRVRSLQTNQVDVARALLLK